MIAGRRPDFTTSTLDGDGHAARKFFNLSERYDRWHDHRVDL
jgi:hypothetical protein